MSDYRAGSFVCCAAGCDRPKGHISDRMTSHADHDVGCLDDSPSLIPGLEIEINIWFVTDCRRDDDPIADIDSDMGRRSALLDFEDLTLELIARAQLLHGVLLPGIPMARCHRGCGRRQRLFSIGCLATISAPNCLFDGALKRAFGNTAACLPVWGAGAPTAASAIFASVDQTDRANRIDVVAAEFHRTLPQCGRAHELEESLRSGQELVALPQNQIKVLPRDRQKVQARC